MNGIRHRLTYANVMATIAVFLVLGGGAYAAFHLPKNSVRSKNIVNGQVKSKDIGKGQVRSSDLAPDEPFHVVGATGEPPFLNDWKNYGFGTAPTAFYKDRKGVVHLKGTVTGGSSSLVFTLPPGYRPVVSQEFAALTVNSGPTRVINQLEVQDGGDVLFYENVGLWASLSGISFRAGH